MPEEEETQSIAAAALGSVELEFEERSGEGRALGPRSSAVGCELAIGPDATAGEATESAATWKRSAAMGKAAGSGDETNKAARGRAEASQIVGPPAGTSKARHTRQTEATKVAYDDETTKRAGPFRPPRDLGRANERRGARPPSLGRSAPGAELPRKTVADAARTASTESAVPSTSVATGQKVLGVAGS